LKNASSKGRRRSSRTVKLHIVEYRKSEWNIGANTTIEVLEKEGEREIVEKGDPIDALLRTVENLIGESEGFFEVRVETGETSEIMGEIAKAADKAKPKLLFQRPERLLRAAIVEYTDLQHEPAGASLYTLDLGKLKWRKPKRQLYIFEGEVSAPPNVYMLIIDTDRGRRFIRLAREDIPPIVSSTTSTSQPQSGLPGESHGNGSGEGGDNSPSS